MNLQLTLLGIYLLGVLIKYFISLQELEKFSAISLSLSNPKGSDPKAEKVVAKWVYAIVAFFGSLLWPILLLFKFRSTEKID